MSTVDQVPDLMSSNFNLDNPMDNWVPRNNPQAPKCHLTSLCPAHRDAKNTVTRHLMHLGFAVSIESTQKTGGSAWNPVKTVSAVILRCACGREYKSRSTGQREVTSRMTGCEWKARLHKVYDAEHAEDVWKYNVRVPYHNHDCAKDMRALFQHRQRDAATLIRIKQQ